MKRVTIVSGKNGGLQAMIPMMEHFVASGRWEVTVLLWDQHGQGHFGKPCILPEGVARPTVVSPQSERVHSMLGVTYLSPDYLTPDYTNLVIVYGDRMDALLGAMIAHERGIPVAHLQAGDESGGIDHANRYATTALSTWAFCATMEMESRLLDFRGAAGLDFSIHQVGDHHIDAIKRVPPLTKGGVLDRWMVHLHPDTLATPEENRRIAEMVVDAVGTEGDYIMPCNDRMHEVILKVYEERGVKPLKYLPLDEYIGRLCLSKGLIGNSSAGVIDAPALGIRSILVGRRQVGRGNRYWLAREGLAHAMKNFPIRHIPDTTYGDGEAGRRTFEILDGAFHD